MNIGRLIFAFTREQYIVPIEAEVVFGSPGCTQCLADYALVDFDHKFAEGLYTCGSCSGSVRAKEKR